MTDDQERWLITGANGFVGRWLRQHIESDPHLSRVHVHELAPSVDLRHSDDVTTHVAMANPDVVIHLAAQTFVPASIEDPDSTYAINFGGTLNLLRALKACGFAGKMLCVSSSDVYGTVDEAHLPIRETQPTRPRNPYAVSKCAAESLCYQWSVTEGFHIVVARPFNHIGPGQSENFALSGFARRVAEIRVRQKPPVIDVGNLEATRDFTDVRDVVRAYTELVAHGASGEIYNVCSGRERSIRSLLDQLVAISGVAIDIRPDPTRMRPAEQLRSRGSADKLHQLTQWAPRVTIERALRDMLDQWEKQLRA